MLPCINSLLLCVGCSLRSSQSLCSCAALHARAYCLALLCAAMIASRCSYEPGLLVGCCSCSALALVLSFGLAPCITLHRVNATNPSDNGAWMEALCASIATSSTQLCTWSAASDGHILAVSCTSQHAVSLSFWLVTDWYVSLFLEQVTHAFRSSCEAPPLACVIFFGAMYTPAFGHCSITPLATTSCLILPNGLAHSSLDSCSPNKLWLSPGSCNGLVMICSSREWWGLGAWREGSLNQDQGFDKRIGTHAQYHLPTHWRMFLPFEWWNSVNPWWLCGDMLVYMACSTLWESTVTSEFLFA